MGKFSWAYGLLIIIILVLMPIAFAPGTSRLDSTYSAKKPEGMTATDIDSGASTTRTVQAGTTSNRSLIAGNVTYINFSGKSVTSMWTGLYGNVTGTITLEDSSGNVFYNWSLAQPDGEVYASRNNTIDWVAVECYNITLANFAQDNDRNQDWYLNMTDLEVTYLNGALTDKDGVDETFNEALGSSFTVANLTIPASGSGCNQTNMYTTGGVQSSGFIETILIQDNQVVDAYTVDCDTAACNGTDSAANHINDLVFVSLIEEGGLTGYDGLAWNYQMIVPEDGHNGNTGTTTYYFYVELE